MRIERRVAINSIAFLIGAIAMVVLLAVRILPTVIGSTYSIFGEFEAAGGVFTNQEVTYRGVQVGRVGEMKLTEDAVSIELVIESQHKIPKQGTSARILFKSAVGEQFVDILPVTDAAPYFEDGDVIGLEMTSIPVQTEDLLRDLDAVLASVNTGHLGIVVHELGSGLRGHGQDLKELLIALDTLAAIGVTHQTEIELGIRSGAQVQDAFNSTRQDFVDAAGSLAEIADVLAERRADLEATLDSTQVLDEALLAILDARRAEIDQIVADLATVTRLTHSQLDDLDLTLTYLGPFLRDVYDAYAAPYFLFNLLNNVDGPPCSYDPSSRESGSPRAIDDASFRQPETGFQCESGGGGGSGTAIPASQPAPTDSWFAIYEDLLR